MVEPGEGEPPGDGQSPQGAVGPMWRRTYQPNEGKHGPAPRGRISREPRNGQEALDFSVRVKETSTARIGIDVDDGDAFVVFRQHEAGEFPERPGQEIFHGYVVAWSDLAQEQKNALLRARLVNLKGKAL
jgi:filamentous hemagglutinin